MKEFNAIKSNIGKLFLLFSVLLLCYDLFYVSLILSKTVVVFTLIDVAAIIVLSLCSIYLFTCSTQKIEFGKDFIKRIGAFFSETKIQNKQITQLSEKSVWGFKEGQHTVLFIKTKSGNSIKIDKPFFKKDWEEIETAIQKVTKLKVKKL